MEARDWKLANQYAQSALISDPDDPDLLTDAAKIAALNGRKRDAAALIVQAAKKANFQPTSRVDHAVQALMDVGELYNAIELLKESLDVNKTNVAHRKTLVGFLGEAERTEQIPPHLKELILQRGFDVPLLLAVTENSSRRFAETTTAIVMDRNPDDHRVRLAIAQGQFDSQEAAECEKTLREILQHHPTFAPAHALLGRSLMQQNSLDAIPAWVEQAPTDSVKYPNYWLTVGDWATADDQYQQAARCYWEASKRDPNNSYTWTRLSQALRNVPSPDGDRSGDSVTEEQLRAIEERIERLLRLREQHDHFSWEGKDSQRIAAEIGEVLFALGRTWEAEAWTAIATTMTKDPTPKLGPLRKSILDQLAKDTSWISSGNQPALQVDLSHWAQPSVAASTTANSDGQQQSSASQLAVIPIKKSHDHIQLRDESERWQLTGIGAKSIPDNSKLPPLIRTLGIGGGTIDYDLDGWADVLVMGAGGKMQNLDSAPNELMRNMGQQFSKVTVAAGVVDRGFGQGVAVGDFNEDGFPDLFFANLGANRLMRNNGDGSFSDCSDLLNDRDWQQWSTSGAFFDLNRDGVCDLLTTNYCQTAKDMDRACPDANGKPGPCHPLKYPAHGDQFFLGGGDGQLKDVSQQLIADVLPGRGLGIVAGALAGSSDTKMGVFVANDMSPNAYFQFGEGDDQPLSENATIRGLAVDGRTLAQASMGIASSDFDGDGDLDFYVTGFALEYNILYDQVSPGIWRDITSKVGLVRPTLPLVGFGTEAIDFDSDGIDELIVTNGHIGDFKNSVYEQPLQVFRRGGKGRFESVEDDQWGDYFRNVHVGRALWTIDVNRDGLSDSIITHAYEQARLLVNRTQTKHNRIAFRLVGTKDSRDAKGAIVRFKCNGQPRTLWALASGGYLCANEPVLRAGIAQAQEITDTTVTWANGETQQVGTLSAGQEHLIIQGDPRSFVSERFAEFAVVEVVKTFGKPHETESLGDFRYDLSEVKK